MDVLDDPQALHWANRVFTEMVSTLGPDQWTHATPCDKWDVRDLVRHVVRGHVRLVAAFSIPPAEAVAPPPDEFDADRVGILRAWCQRAESALNDEGSLVRMVEHRALGPMPGGSYARVRWVDVLVHSWDLSQSLERPFSPPDDMAEAALTWTISCSDALTASGAFRAPQGAHVPGAKPWEQLLLLMGRQPY
jgi:uncharacterized protein (TIGR03086 family)